MSARTRAHTHTYICIFLIFWMHPPLTHWPAVQWILGVGVTDPHAEAKFDIGFDYDPELLGWLALSLHMFASNRGSEIVPTTSEWHNVTFPDCVCHCLITERENFLKKKS